MIISSRRSLLPRPEVKMISKWWIGLFISLFIFTAWTLPVFFGQPLPLVVGIFLFFAIVTGVVYSISCLLNRNSLRQLVEKRKNESICTFARSFDCSPVDTRIIRAVYEEIQHWCGNFPVRASDHFEKDLNIDPEDIEHMVGVIAFRTKRTLEHYENNPFYLKIDNVAGLVHFFSHQPLKI